MNVYEYITNLLETMELSNFIIGMIIAVVIAIIAKFAIRAWWRGLFK